MPADLQKARELFLHAVGKLPPEEWDDYVGQACGGDAELKQQVGQLLQVHREAGSFLDRPAAAVGATAALAPALGDKGAAVPLRERPGTVIGPYKLLQQIGEGGMGTVFMAEQTRPVQRRVALKVIKAGMDSAQVVARFEAERQALAVMDHVNIARVFDGGATEAGWPYFVMELVHGVPITKYCDDNHLTPRERLELFVPVCQAIQHAHQKGIIHRDIKPSNVMITLYDGKPVPKVIDFGVAKATEQKLTERTLFTQYGTMVGTLEYMSPEQAETSALGVDTRSDIFSLGVLLYELLTGGTPLSHKRVQEAAYGEILRMIKEEEPPRPSTRLSDSGTALASISAQRKTEPAKLSKLMRGELDWIVMKTLEKDRNRRYETANGFAADVQRYLNDETVQACPPSSWYRLRKFVRRNKTPVMAACLVLLALVGGVVGTTWGLVLARQQRDVAEEARNDEAAQRQQAVGQKNRAEAAEALAKNHLADVTRQKQRTEEQAAIARAVNEFLQHSLLGQADIGNQSGGATGGASAARDPDVKVRTLLDRAAREIEGKFVGQPLTEAAIRQTLGDTYMALGQYAESQRHLERAVRLRSAKLGADHPDTLLSKNNLALLYKAQGHYGKAEALHMAVLAVQTAILGADHPSTLVSKNNLAMVYLDQGQYAKAEALHMAVLAARTAALGADHPLTLGSKHNLAMVYLHQGQYAKAEALDKQVLAVRTAILGADHPDTLDSKANLAILFVEQGKYDQAEALYKEVLAVRTAKQGADHPNTLGGKENLANLYNARGNYARAETMQIEVLNARTSTLGADHPQTLMSKHNMACTYTHRGKFDQAEALFKEVLAVRTAKLGANHPYTLSSKGNLASVYMAQGKYDQAEALLKEVVAGQTAKLGADHPFTLMYKINLACVYWDQGKYDLAETAFKQALAVQTAKVGADHPDTLRCKSKLALTYSNQGKCDLAETLFKEVIAGQTAKLGADHPYTLSSKGNLALTYSNQGKCDLAETLFKEVIAGQTAKLGADHPDTLGCKLALGNVYSNQGKYDQAEALYKQVLAVQTAKPATVLPGTLLCKGNLGVVYFNQGKYDMAEPLCREAVEGVRKRLGPAHPHTQFYIRKLAACYEKMGQPAKAEPLLREAWEQAVADLSKAIERKPGDATLRRDRARLRVRVRRSDEALIDFTKALELNPADWGIWDDRGMLYLAVQQPEKALADFTKSIAIYPKASWVWAHRSQAYRALARWREAIADLAKTVELDPQNVGASNELAWLLVTCPDVKLRDPSRALKTAKQTVELVPKEGSHWKTLGVAQYRARAWKCAVAALEKSMELRKGGDSFDWFFLAMAQHQRGDKDQARKRFDQAVEWMDKNQPKNVELRRFRAEAAELLGIKK